MGVERNTKYYNKIITRLSMKSRELLSEEVTLVYEAYKKNTKENIHIYATKNKTLPFVAKLLHDLALDKCFWGKIYASFEERSEAILLVLTDIFATFKSEGIQKIFLYENFGVLLAVDKTLGCFASGDVDIFADASSKKEITEILVKAGFLPVATNESTKTVKIEYFNEKFLEEGFGINVMWKPLSRLKLPFQIDINNSVEWNQLENYKNTSIQLPNKNVLMYLCLLHTSVHSYHRAPDIRLYTDTDRISLLKPNWDEILKFARLDKTLVRTLTSAILSKKLTGISITENDRIEEYKRKHKNIDRLVKRVYDAENEFLKDEPGRLGVLLIEIFSSDVGVIRSAFGILFPSEKWIRDYYLQRKKGLLKGYLMHLKNLFL